MRSAKSIIEQAQENKVVLYLKGSQLAYLSEERGLTQELKSLVIEYKNPIVAYLLQQELKKEKEDSAVMIEWVDKEQLLPLSFSQQGLWFVDQLEGGSSQYNIPAAFRLTGAIDKASMRKALDTLVERHEVLRTVFRLVEGEAAQVILPISSIDLYEHDLSKHDKSRQKQLIHEFVATEMSETFDLQTDLMLRVKILVLSEQEHILLFTIHHIASDGWSQAIMIREFATLYDSYCKKLPNSLPALNIQYSDYAYWQRQYYTDDRIGKQLAFWQDRLAEAPKCHVLPFDYPRKPQQQFSGKTHSWLVDLETLNALKNLAQDNNATLFMVLYTAYSVFLGRWSQSRDVVIGSPIAGRTHPQVAPLIGYFINSIVYRSQWVEGQTFSSLLTQNRHHTLAAYDNQNIPFESLVDKLKIERELSHSPLFQLMFTLQNNEKSDLQLKDLTIEAMGTANAIIKYDMEMVAEEHEKGISFFWNYSTYLFDEQTVKTMAASFNFVLRQVATNANISIDELRLGEKAKLCSLPTFEFKALTHQFEQQVAQTPDNIAIQFKSDKVSYQQLNARANQLARYLLEQGEGKNKTVYICFNHSISCYLALLAVLKTGGIYRYYDGSRANALINDLGRSMNNVLVLTDQTLSLDEKHQIILVDENLFLTHFSTLNLEQSEVHINVENSAISNSLYDDFEINHVTASAQLRRQQQTMELSAQSSLLLLPESGYFSATEWLAGLTAGSKLVLFESSQDIVATLRDKVVTHMTLTPALLAEVTFNNSYDLKHIVVISNEACNRLLWQWAQSYNVSSVLNINLMTYISSCHVTAGMPVNLGGILDTAQVKVISSEDEQTPVGAIGELYLYGLKTEKACSQGDSSFHKTGLKVRRNNDSSLALISSNSLGIDCESALIETVISQQLGVNQVVVCDGVAFVSLMAGQQETILDKIKQHLKLVLPAYLLPKEYLLVPTMPLLAYKQVDRHLLSRQISHWQYLLKSYPEPEYFSDIKPLYGVCQNSYFALTDEAVTALTQLAKRHNATMQLTFSAIFSILVSFKQERECIVNAVSGLSQSNDAEQVSTLTIANYADKQRSGGELISIFINDLLATLDYRYVNSGWVTDKYNDIHHANCDRLFDYLLLFNATENVGKIVEEQNNAVTLQISHICSEQVYGLWRFDNSKIDLASIVQLTNMVNLFIPWIEQEQNANLLQFQEKLKAATQSKVRQVKRKFKPGIKNRSPKMEKSNEL
jgi:non-ribosomal peptide synthetase component F